MSMIGGIENVNGHLLPVATRTRRKGLKLAGTARASRATSLVSTATAVIWNRSFSSTELPLQIRFKQAGKALRWYSELGAEGSNAKSRLVSAGNGSTVYTSLASNTWSEWENIHENYKMASEDGQYSYVLGYISTAPGAAGGLFSYEVQTLPIAKP